jgi:hypothetical protein
MTMIILRLWSSLTILHFLLTVHRISRVSLRFSRSFSPSPYAALIMSLPPPVPYTRVDPKSTDHRPVLGWRCPPLEPPSLLYSRSRCSSMRLRGMQRALHPAWSPEELLSLLQIYEGSPGIAVFARDVARAIGLNIEDAEVRVLLADRPEHSSPPCLLRGVLPKNHQCNAFCLDPLRALLMGASVRAYKSVGNLSPYLPPLSTPPIQCIAATQTPQPPIAVCASTQTATCSYRLVPLPVSSATQTPAQCDSNRRTISTQTPPARSYTIRILMPVQPLLVIRVLSPVTAVSQSLRFLPSPHVGAAPPRSVPALTLNSDHRQDLADIRALALPSMVSPLAPTVVVKRDHGRWLVCLAHTSPLTCLHRVLVLLQCGCSLGECPNPLSRLSLPTLCSLGATGVVLIRPFMSSLSLRLRLCSSSLGCSSGALLSVQAVVCAYVALRAVCI